MNDGSFTLLETHSAVADLRGARGTQNRMLAPPGELAPPPRGNPGSATAQVWTQILIPYLCLQLGLEFEFESVQCENLCTVQ